MKKIILQGEDILRLIPQRFPIVMVDKFYGIKEDSSYSGFTIQPDTIFCQSEIFSEVGIIEHIAQSAALRIGYLFTQKEKPIPLGFIGSIDKYKNYKLAKIGSELYTEINIVQEVGDITVISAKTFINDVLIAECRMKILIKQ